MVEHLPLSRARRAVAIALPCVLLLLPAAVHASVAYGSINNFDAVNDTGVPCHGFEIEIDGIHSTDVTYTYDWNHYGVPRISEDKTDPLHPKVFVRYESARNPDGTWAAYTAVPAGPIAPTDGHQFTNPAVNFGGEHFGVGFYGTPTALVYNWLKDDGSGTLVHGGTVNIATPSFTYIPPVNAVPAQVQAVIVPPPPPAPPVLEFGEASWVKETRTAAHNNAKVELRDLVSDDPSDPHDRNWQNGEAAEVEVEWQLMQTDFNAADGGANGKVEGAPEALPNGDEVITRRYDFYTYVGPIDPETGEALADRVGPDGLHGAGVKTINGVETDLSTVLVVGDYVGAQMAGFDPAGQIGLIDHLQDGELDVPYVERSVVVGGTPPIITTRSGALPRGMDFDVATGVLSGTPGESGTFVFTVHSTDAASGDVTRTFNLTVAEAGVVQPLHSTVSTAALPAEGGSTSGDGEYINGGEATVTASANPGFAFAYWSDGGTEVSTSESYQFTATVNRRLVANFVHAYRLTYLAGAHGTIRGATPQTVVRGSAGTAVTASPAPGWCLAQWSDGLATATRTDSNVAADLTVTAAFRAAQAVAPEGTFLAFPDEARAAAGSGWWDLSGTYALSAAGRPLVLSLTHDAKGRLTGSATYTVGKGGAVNLPIRGGVKGSAGSATVRAVLQGADPAGTASVSLRLELAVDGANRQLVGRLRGRVTVAGLSTAVDDGVALDIPAPMDGSWGLALHLAQGAREVTGTAVLTLSNGAHFAYAVKGRRTGASVLLSFAPDSADPGGRDLGMVARVTPLEAGWARLEMLSGKGYGQTLGW